jgi:predicted amidophosphoribosyltransferase
VPVPLHPTRYAERGYNQAALVATGVADALGLPLVTHALVRVKVGAAQAGLDRLARLSALTGAFTCAAPGGGGGRTERAISGKDVLLVDDVLTTGATLAACAAALRQAGARRVFGCVVAVGINRKWWRQALDAQDEQSQQRGMSVVNGRVNVIPRDINRS